MMYDELVKRLRARAKRENNYYEHGGDIINEAAEGGNMSILIEGLTLPKNEDGTYFIPSYEVRGVEISAVVMTLMIDQKTQKLSVQLWDGNPYGLAGSYPCSELPPHGDLIDRGKLYEQTANWEAQALDQTLRYRPEEDRDEWRWWSAVLKERSAFKFDVADAPTIIPAEPPKEET